MKSEAYQFLPKKRKVMYWYFKYKPTIEQLQDQINEWEMYIKEHKMFLRFGMTAHRAKNMIKNFKFELKIFKKKLKEMKQNDKEYYKMV
jgi:hypothetical protein